MNAGEGTTLVRFALAVPLFALLATLNSAGYRYGASDQAFYQPAVLERLDPELFPRDSPLIAAQARLTLTDETLAALARLTRASLPVLFVAAYLAALAALALAAALIGQSLYRSAWTIVALLAVLTLRHAIADSGVNTLEGYFHPRQAAFGLGALALAGFLRGRTWPCVALLAAAALVHPTTALWFGLWLGIAGAVAEKRYRLPLAVAGAAILTGGACALLAGPLAGRLLRMDPPWLAVLQSKDYLFPFSWPVSSWLVNLAYLPLILWVRRVRRSAGLTSPREEGMVAGCLALLLVFVASLPLNALRVALAVQLQPARIFWMLDFLAALYIVWALAEGRTLNLPRARTAALALAGLTAIRGGYVMLVEFPERPIVQLGIPDTHWGRAMAWARRSDPASHWLADPLHASLYGTSLRVAGERDVFVETVKDSAIAMYDRSTAMRVLERLSILGDFGRLTAPHAKALARRYDLDYLITDRELPLPVAFVSGPLRIYRLE